MKQKNVLMKGVHSCAELFIAVQSCSEGSNWLQADL